MKRDRESGPPPVEAGAAAAATAAAAAVARAGSVEELEGLIREAEARGLRVAVKRGAEEEEGPGGAESLLPLLPQGGVVAVVPAFLNERAKVEALIDEDGAAGAPSVRVSRAALVRDLAAEQAGSKIGAIRGGFLPVGADPAGSVLAGLFRGGDPLEPRHYFQRSAAPLRSRVRSFSYLPLSPSAEQERGGGVRRWDREPSGAPPDFGDKLVLDATLELGAEGARVEARRLLFLYDRAAFENDIMDGFCRNVGGAADQGVLDGVDLTVEVFNLPLYVASPMFVLITCCSANRRHDAAVEALFPELRPPDEAVLLVDPVDVECMGPGAPERRKSFSLPSEEYGGTFPLSDCREFSDWLKPAVHAAAYDANQNLQAHFRLTSDGSLCASALVFQPEARARSGWSHRDLDSFPDFPPVNERLLPKLGEPDASIPTRSPRGRAPAEPPPARRRAEPPPAPGAAGPLWDVPVHGPGHADYRDLCAQYASYGASYPDAAFKPGLVVRPRTSDEICRVVNHAREAGKKVVVRSGGHQYCGFSSGDGGYLQVLMDSMKDEEIKISSENAGDVRERNCSIVSSDKDGAQWFVEVAARCRLRDASAGLLKHRLTIPHGECPLVGIGGHVQTGGYGHQMRGLGLCLDYVYSFDMVVLTEKDATARLVTVYRPELNIGEDRNLNNALYKGVLGGSPGAFGVLTRIKFLAVHDDDPAFKESHNVQAVYPYQGGNIHRGAAQIVRMMLNLVVTKTLVEGLDVFVTIVSRNIANLFEWGIVVPELAYTGRAFTNQVKDQVADILECCKAGAIFGVKDVIQGQKLEKRPPSQVAHHGVRTKNGGVTKTGREFDLAYKKRVNVMLDSDELSGTRANDFADGFGRLVADVILDRDLLLVVQMNLGGGKALSNDTDKSTGIPYRNQSFGFVFDVFYKPGAKPLARASKIQERMQELIDATRGESPGFNHRLFWGSFGRENGETDMSKPFVRDLYFGSDDAYGAMQRIKDTVDPNNIFTTEFTVQKSAPA
jgi:FAD/FMN-containing dehydrogenase